jgi:class 3 adenylate cyclase/predicted ATPase
MQNIAHWLADLGLDKYASVFSEAEIAFSDLVYLSEDDLKELGLPMGPRRRVLGAITKIEGATAPATTSETTSTFSAPSADAERRQLTVMFADLVGSTALSTHMDIELYRDLIRTYQNACASVVTRYDGFVAKYMGDGVLVYFGWPRAHEDDAERAINVGLELIAAVQALDGGEAGALAVRIGVATGRVVVGDIIGEHASQEAAIAGEAPNLAARLQSIAAPNEVVVAQATYEIAGAMFDCTNLGEQTLKGFGEPVNAWRINTARKVESRFEAMRKQAMTPFVGRLEESDVLDRRWQRACTGNGQVVLISGEPGIGKSRIIEVLEERLGTQTYSHLRFQCSPYHSNSALYPVIEQLVRSAGILPQDSPVEQLDKLETLVAEFGSSNSSTVPLIAPLLAISVGDRYPAINVSPPMRKRMMLGALVDLFLGLSARQPLLFQFEDAHWIDPTSREFLDLLIVGTNETATLVIVSFRPSFKPTWIGENHVTMMNLNRLNAAACLELAKLVGQSAELTPSIVNEIVARTDGLPLFVEEITRSVIEAIKVDGGNTANSGSLAIPASIEDSLMARLDRLGPLKETAQIASVVGRSFQQDSIVSIMDVEEQIVEATLEQLVQSGLFYRKVVSGGLGFEFKHALMQEVAYQSMLKKRRQQYHARTAEFLETAATQAAAPEFIAHHHTEAGQIEKSIDWWLKACQHEMQRSAHIEGESHLRRGLKLLDRLTDQALRDQYEIALQNMLGVCIMPTRGFGHSDVDAAFSRAAELSEQSEDNNGLFIALRGKGQYNMLSGSVEVACADAARILGLAESLDNQDYHLEAHHLGWSALCFRGDFQAAQAHAEAGIASYDRDRDHHLAYVYSGHDPGVCCRAFGSLSCCQLGAPDRALAMCDDGLALADDLQHPFSSATVYWAKGLLHQLRREVDQTYQAGTRLLQHSKESGLPVMMPVGKIFQGIALANKDHLVDGISLIREGIAGFRSFGTLFSVPSYFPTLAAAHAATGQINDGFAAIEEGLAMAQSSSDHFNLPELYRTKASLLLAQSSRNALKAEAMYLKAIDIARKQNARLLELRATSNLARLWGENNKREPATEMLSQIYNSFVEGFDTPDLKEAISLLDTLA